MTLDGNAVRSVDRAAALLLALGDSHGEAGVTELARRLGLHNSWRHHDRRPHSTVDAQAQPRPAAGDVPAGMRTLPGGADSNFRAWGENTVYVDRGKGGRVWDLDGNEYIDLRMGYGPVILGHADDRVDDYVNERMRRGVSFSLTSEDEVRAMELLCELTGWVEHGPHDRVRHRGHDARDARRPGLHGPRQDREVRGPVPRRARLRADQRRCRTTSRTSGTPTTRSAWRGVAASPARSRTRSFRPATTTSSAFARSSSARATRSPRSSWSRSWATPRASCPSPASTRRCGR